MNAPSVLIATAKVRPDCIAAFSAWKARHDLALAQSKGFLGSDVIPPDEHSDRWTILVNFDSQENITAWQQSQKRAEVLAELAPLTFGSSFGEVMQEETPGAEQPRTMVTQIIFSRIKPGLEEDYRAWVGRIEEAQARYPGYRGTYFQPPSPGGNHWLTMIRFDTTEHLNAWLVAPERAALLEEAKAVVENVEMLRLATAFPGWVPINPETGEGPPSWKTALLVLLGLYPIIALELLYLNPKLEPLGPAWAIFTGNVLSVSATSFLTMPALVRAFGWWLFTDAKTKPRATLRGVAILAILFLCEIGFVAWLFSGHGK
ncbi:antibiotic biosynthesis monooxygenase [Singulisphaera rosea]